LARDLAGLADREAARFAGLAARLVARDFAGFDERDVARDFAGFEERDAARDFAGLARDLAGRLARDLAGLDRRAELDGARR
jgi:hypothetical protein